MSQTVAIVSAFRWFIAMVQGPTIGDRITYRILAKRNIALTTQEMSVLHSEGFDYSTLHQAFEAAAAPARVANGGALCEDFTPPQWSIVPGDDFVHINHNRAAESFVAAVIGDIQGSIAYKANQKGYLVGLVMTAMDNLLRGDDTILFGDWSERVLDGRG